MAKINNYVKMEIYLTPENAKLLKQVNSIMCTPHRYINDAIEATASMKKFKEMRDDDGKESKKVNNTEDAQLSEKGVSSDKEE